MRAVRGVCHCIKFSRQRCVPGATTFQGRSSTRGLQTWSQKDSGYEVQDLADNEADDLLAYVNELNATTLDGDAAHEHGLDRPSSSESQPQDPQDRRIRRYLTDTTVLSDPRVRLYKGAWPHSKYPDINRLLVQRGELHVIMNNGLRSFDPFFIRDSCQCPACVDVHSGQKKFNTTDIPSSLTIRRVMQRSDGQINVYWMNDVPTVSSEHFTSLSPSWLIDQISSGRRHPRSNAKPWDRRQMEASFTKVDYRAYTESTEGYYTALDQLNEHGLVVIENVPEDDKMVEHIGEKIGPLRHTFYGGTWDVKDKPNAENVAYTSGYLGLHMDLLYMREPPGLQLLHCIKTAGTGGESIFSDALQAASIIENVSPEAMEILSSFPVAYHYTKGGHHFQDSKPVFEMSPYHYKPFRASAIPYILNTNWSPPFQGPFRVDIGLKDHGARLQKWHRAAQAFDQALNHPLNLFQYRLKEGDCVIFNNRRVLHGRTAFTSGTDGAIRWLKGAYLDHDDFKSQLRVRQKTKKIADHEMDA